MYTQFSKIYDLYDENEVVTQCDGCITEMKQIRKFPPFI
jgi:hypothetical protein